MEHFFPQIQVKTKKKRSSPKMKHFFSPNSSGDLRSDAHQSQIIGEDADEDHTQIIGADVYPPSPPSFSTTACSACGHLLQDLIHLFLAYLASESLCNSSFGLISASGVWLNCWVSSKFGCFPIPRKRLGSTTT